MNEESVKAESSLLMQKVNDSDTNINEIGNMITDMEGKISQLLRPPIPDTESKLDRNKVEESNQSELGDRLDRLNTRLLAIHGRLNHLYVRIDN